MKVMYLLPLLLSVSACTTFQLAEIDAQKGLICEWGKHKFNLCTFDNQDERVEALIAEMTLDEKLGQMTQSVWHNGVSPKTIRKFSIGSIIHTEGPTPGKTAVEWADKFDQFQRQALSTRLGIPLLIAVDAVHGQNTYDGAVIFPHNIGMAATRNMKLIERAAEITAIETAGTGFNWTFSPCIAMPQHEHWGRVYEGFSEDRDLTTAAVIASVNGHQGGQLAARNTVAATAKHFIGDGATKDGVEGGNAILSEALIQDHLLPPYRAAVDQDIAAVMVGFNSVNDVNMHQHQELVTDVLKGQLGFDGVVVTDWNGGQRFGPAHTVINAGVDLAMQPGNHEEFISDLKGSVLDGTVSANRIDDAVRRILALKFKLGLFTDPLSKREFAGDIGSSEHREVARQAVRESLVLLKNDTNTLPLNSMDKIAVVGEHGDNSGLQSGGWSIHWQGQSENYSGATTIFEAVKNVAPNAEYLEQGCTSEMSADTAIVVVGERPYAEFEGDSDELWLIDDHKKLISDCRDQGKKVVTVLISGRTLVIEEDLERSNAFIAAWLPGSEGGGIADFLFSIDGFQPVGKSPYAWPRKVSDLPIEQYDERALFQYGYGILGY